MNQFVLDAYAARSCPVKTFNAFDPVLRGPAQPLDESLRESFQGGSDFRRGVLDRIAATPGAVDLRDRRLEHCAVRLQPDVLRMRSDGEQRERSWLDSCSACYLRCMESCKSYLWSVYFRCIHGAEILLPEKPRLHCS